MATAWPSPTDIAAPLRAMFRAQANLRVLLGEVTGWIPRCARSCSASRGSPDCRAEDLPAEVRAATASKGADVVFDLVGGVMFSSAVDSLALRGKLIEVTTTGQRGMSFDLADFYHNESRLIGVDTLKRDLTASARVLEALTPGFVAGDYRTAPIAKTCALSEAKAAYRKVAAGAPGRIVLRPQE